VKGRIRRHSERSEEFLFTSEITPMAPRTSILALLWAKTDRPGVKAFFLAILALGIALLLAVYSGAAAEIGSVALAATSALFALAIAGWVAVTLVPTLAKRTPLRWIGYRIDYKVSRAGWMYFGATLLVALAALNTGNNLLFLVLACLVSIILMSGVLSSVSLAGVDLRIDLPEHIFAGQTVRASVELDNQKVTLPSFALRVEAVADKKTPNVAVLQTPVFFPYIPRQEKVRQGVPVTFLRRGLHVQDTFRIVTRFPFGFLQKARRLALKSEALVYPSIESTAELAEIVPGLEGSIESFSKGRGQDLHALREYLPSDSASHVHWKASARTGSLMVREFAREDDCRVLLVLDPYRAPLAEKDPISPAERFEQAVSICAGLAWHFYERSAMMQFRSAGIETGLAPAEESIFTILRHLATAQPEPPDQSSGLLQELAASPELFKIIVTSRPRGSIAHALWHSSYVIFLDSLENLRPPR
jgi:uncharacterized protein (DUF58 family)